MKKLFFVLSLIPALALTSCKDTRDDDLFDLEYDYEIGEGGGVDDVSVVPLNKYTARMEVPARNESAIFIQHSTRDGADSIMTYCLEFDTKKYHSNWVAFRFDANTRSSSVNRKSYDIKPQYPADPDCEYSLSGDASFSGYDHGHLCASNDRRYSRESNDQTFYMTNMSPQISTFNQKYWTIYESYVQTQGRNDKFADTLYVVKGGTIREDQVNGYITVDSHKVPVPKFYWMALLAVKNGEYMSIGFWMEHKTYTTPSDEKAEMLDHALSIDELETLTGFNFFVNLPDDIEREVESSYSGSAWGF